MILFYQPSHARRGVASRRSRNSGIGVLFHRSQFDWPEHILSVVLTSSHCLCRTFFTICTLTGKRDAFSFPESRAGR